MKEGDIDMKCQCCGERLPERTISSKKSRGEVMEFNTTAKCTKCDWSVTYNKQDDWRHVEDLKKCPKCSAEIKRVPYKPIS